MSSMHGGMQDTEHDIDSKPVKELLKGHLDATAQKEVDFVPRDFGTSTILRICFFNLFYIFYFILQ